MKTGKINKLEATLLILTGMTLTFMAWWHLSAGNTAGAYTVTVQQTAPAAQLEETDSTNPAPGLLEGERINVNTASAADLERLPGIGVERAQDIIAYRNENGPFRIAEDLTNVSGIGEKTLQGLLDYITVGEG